jgi:hypothetical protein
VAGRRRRWAADHAATASAGFEVELAMDRDRMVKAQE